jgi:branched-chain amino acid transport system substrate-binding protein
MCDKNTCLRMRRGAGALALLAAMALGAGASERSPTEPREHEVLLGGLFPLSGDFAALGQTHRAAMELAIEDVNRYLAGNAAGVRFAPAIEDTRFEPELALEKTQALQARGVQLLIGPPASAQLAHIKPHVDTADLLLVSHASTASSLAIPGDNIFRFAPANELEGVAVSTMMWEDGIRAVVPIWRDDAGNADLAEATRAGFTALGGTVLEGVQYAPATEDLASTVAALRAQVDQAIAHQGAARVAVYLAAFEEVVQLFATAEGDPVLSAVNWYGGNGTARLEALRGDTRAAEFAMRVGYPSAIYGPDEGARDIWQPLAARIRARANLDPDGYALAADDAGWVVARAYVASGATQDIERLKRAFTTAAARHYGATGWTVLNEAGDRRHGDYDFWAIRLEEGVPRWRRVAVYESRMGRLIR